MYEQTRSGRGSGGPHATSPHSPAPHHWHALDDLLAEMCERTGGRLEDLHDRGRGILEHCRPDPAVPIADVRSRNATPVWTHVHRVVGSLAHLEDAAPDDARAIRAISADVYALAERLAVFPAEPPT
ncbi:hypothetical protein [Saccharomonospora iraqiensis]|uniref:hypothetical protein n=1 Tax=Saccharomonospora iraqiensis TaxID=52698 RepID=UPI00047C3D47|nr:hypothetical protein [Saccharomonospora iraqiensis]